MKNINQLKLPISTIGGGVEYKKKYYASAESYRMDRMEKASRLRPGADSWLEMNN